MTPKNCQNEISLRFISKPNAYTLEILAKIEKKLQ